MKKNLKEHKFEKENEKEYSIKFTELSRGKVELKAGPTPEEEKRKKKIGQLVVRKTLILKKKDKLYNLATGFAIGCFAFVLSTFVFIGSMLYKAYAFSKTDEFKKAQDAKSADVIKDYESGKINEEQYNNANSYLNGPNFMIDTMLEGNSKEKKDYNKFNVAGTASSILTIASGAAALGFGIACSTYNKKADKVDDKMRGL